MNIKRLVIEAHENSLAHGFWEDIKDIKLLKSSFKNDKISIDVNAINTRLLLTTCEVAEATEALRKNDRDNFREELADVCIRIFDLVGGLDIDLETEIIKKMEINKLREYKHGKKF